MGTWTGVLVAAVPTVLAIASQWPGLSADDRARSRIAKDAELWSQLPPGAQKDDLKTWIDESTAALLTERRRDHTWSAGLNSSLVLWLITFAFFILSNALPTDGRGWADLHVYFTITAGLFAVAATVLWLILAGVAVRWTARKVKSWARPGEETQHAPLDAGGAESDGSDQDATQLVTQGAGAAAGAE